MNRNQLVDRCKAIIKEAYEEATEMIVAYLELHPKQAREPLCKEIDPDNWSALDARVRRAEARKATSETKPDPTRALPPSRIRHARSAIRTAPAEVVEDLTVEEQRKLAQALDLESAKRQQEREKTADEKFRETVGDETADDLELKQELQSTEYLLIKARGNLRGFVKQAGELGIDNTPEAWRTSCLDWVNDLEGHLGMAKALLAGGDIDWTAFEDMLGEEVS